MEKYKDPSFKKVGKLTDRAIEKELAKKRFPVVPHVKEGVLCVSFPQQIGYAHYDIENDKREFVGSVFAVEQEKGLARRGIITALVFESPVVIAVEGMFAPLKLEVWLRDELIGRVVREPKKDTFRKPATDVFKLYSLNGDAELLWREEDVRVQSGSKHCDFDLQLNRDYIPLLSHSDLEKRGCIVYRPDLTFCDPVIVMAFVLSLRMIYSPGDF